MKMPKSIVEHPAVEEIVTGESEGSDYRYWIFLKSGWRFTCGAKAECTGGGFNSVKDFRYAAPVQVNN